MVVVVVTSVSSSSSSTRDGYMPDGLVSAIREGYSIDSLECSSP